VSGSEDPLPAEVSVITISSCHRLSCSVQSFPLLTSVSYESGLMPVIEGGVHVRQTILDQMSIQKSLVLQIKIAKQILLFVILLVVRLHQQLLSLGLFS
jgi:hypothetical protein